MPNNPLNLIGQQALDSEVQQQQQQQQQLPSYAQVQPLPSNDKDTTSNTIELKSDNTPNITQHVPPPLIPTNTSSSLQFSGGSASHLYLLQTSVPQSYFPETSPTNNNSNNNNNNIPQLSHQQQQQQQQYSQYYNQGQPYDSYNKDELQQFYQSYPWSSNYYGRPVPPQPQIRGSFPPPTGMAVPYMYQPYQQQLQQQPLYMPTSLQPLSSSPYLQQQQLHQPQTQRLQGRSLSLSSIQSSSTLKPKRTRRKRNEVERLYFCNYQDCTKGYGSLSHLNGHIVKHGHGKRRHPEEFTELRKFLKEREEGRG